MRRLVVKVHKFGSDLALKIPKAMARMVGLKSTMLVKGILVGSQMILTTGGAPAWTLEQLSSGVTSNNLHSETDTGEAGQGMRFGDGVIQKGST